MVMQGEVTIELPDDSIPKPEFTVRYEEYKSVLEHIAAEAELSRKKELVTKRKLVLERSMRL